MEKSVGSQHFASICKISWGASESKTAVGYHVAGGAFPGAVTLNISGCANADSASPGLQLSTPKATSPGTFTDGSASYTDDNGQTYGAALAPYQLVITKLDPPGGVIEGTFAVTVAGPTDAARSLTGKFHVCRVADELVP